MAKKLAQHQVAKAILFGKTEAKRQSNDWHAWPEPQKSIYKRLQDSGLLFISCSQRKQLEAAARTVADIAVQSMDVCSTEDFFISGIPGYTTVERIF